jgi:hypothetical protein
MISFSVLSLLAFTALQILAEPSTGCGEAPTRLKNGMNTIASSGVSRHSLSICHRTTTKKPAPCHLRIPCYRGLSQWHKSELLRSSFSSRRHIHYGILSRPRPYRHRWKVDWDHGYRVQRHVGWWRTGGKYGDQDLVFVDKITWQIDAD